jgi:hypothetical protein
MINKKDAIAKITQFNIYNLTKHEIESLIKQQKYNDAITICEKALNNKELTEETSAQI